MTDTNKGVTFKLKSGLEFEEPYLISDFQELLYDTLIVKECQGEIIITTKPKSPMLPPCFGYGFLDTVYNAYNGHKHLVLKPNDVWLSIATSLSLYVNKHAKKMQELFVEHEGKIELKVFGGGDLNTADWNEMIDTMVGLIEKNTKVNTREWLEPNFSTTTQEIATADKVTMMATFQKYFEYKMVFLCGIPSVTLEGTLEDWENLKQKVQNLRQLKRKSLKRWATLLDYVLNKFVETYTGNVDKKFWSKMCSLDPWGSGSNHFHGLMNVFIPFNENEKYMLKGANPRRGKWCRINTNKAPPAIVEVPIEIDDSGTKHKTKFVAGFLATEHDQERNSVSPSINWAVIDLPNRTESRKMDPDQWKALWQTFKKGLYFVNTHVLS